MANQLEIDVVLKLSQLQDEVKGLKDGLAKQGEEAGKGFASGLGSSVLKTIAALGIAKLLKDTFSTAIREAVEDEQAITRFNQSLAGVGLYSKEASLSMEELASSISKATGLAGNQIVEAASLGTAYVKTTKQLEDLTKAAVDFAAGRPGMDLNQAMQVLGQTTTGSAGKLAKLVPELRNLTEEQLKAGAAIDIVAKKYAGFGEALGNTFDGALKKSQTSFNETLSSLGQLITRSPAVIAAMNFISKAFDNLGTILNGPLKSGTDVLRDFVLKAIDSGRILVQVFGPAIEFVLNLVNALAKSLGSLAGFFAEAMSGNITGAFALLKEDVASAFDGITETPVSDKIDTMAANMYTAVQAASPKLREVGVIAGNSLSAGVTAGAEMISLQSVVDRFKLTADEITQMSRTLAGTLKNTLSSGFTSAFAAIGGALVKGEGVFAAFGKAILGMFGDIALQLGQFYLLLGIGNLWLNPGASAGQIAAGLGLTILGGALKAIAGGGGSAPAAAGASGGGSGGGSASAPLGQQTQPSEQRAGLGTQIAVNIQGNVLDRRETGLMIAEAIQESFQTDGVVIARGAIT